MVLGQTPIEISCSTYFYLLKDLQEEIVRFSFNRFCGYLSVNSATELYYFNQKPIILPSSYLACYCNIPEVLDQLKYKLCMCVFANFKGYKI